SPVPTLTSRSIRPAGMLCAQSGRVAKHTRRTHYKRVDFTECLLAPAIFAGNATDTMHPRDWFRPTLLWNNVLRRPSTMDEREFYDERQETKKASLTCPHCRQENEYDIGWVVRMKKRQL